MRLDEDYLRELELWSLFELRGKLLPAAALPESSKTLPSLVREVSDVHGARVNKSTSIDSLSRPLVSAPPGHAPHRAREEAVTPPPESPRGSKSVLPISESKITTDPARAARITALDWQGLAAEASKCNACGLCKQRKQAVLGVGATDAPWLFIGEGPGAEEDQQGEPFVGPAGKLLDAMLQAAGLARGREVYIANVVKCRPPGNRTPTAEETAECAPFLDRQIDLIKPKLIVALGKTAVMRLAGSDASMASLRGQVLQYRGIPVVATYHPAYLLRNLPEKLKAWEDLIFARQKMAALAAAVT